MPIVFNKNQPQHITWVDEDGNSNFVKSVFYTKDKGQSYTRPWWDVPDFGTWKSNKDNKLTAKFVKYFQHVYDSDADRVVAECQCCLDLEFKTIGQLINSTSGTGFDITFENGLAYLPNVFIGTSMYVSDKIIIREFYGSNVSKTYKCDLQYKTGEYYLENGDITFTFLPSSGLGDVAVHKPSSIQNGVQLRLFLHDESTINTVELDDAVVVLSRLSDF